MEYKIIEEQLIKCLAKQQERENEAAVEITSATTPAQLPGFDSYRAIAVILDLCKELSIDLEPDFELFATKTKKGYELHDVAGMVKMINSRIKVES